MAQLKMYNPKGDAAETIELNDAVFAVALNGGLVHQVYTAQRANAREPWAHSKDKSEIAGGGRKPWKQKGTGRARHGSIRSPIWRGGGVTFGPLNLRNYTKKINKKVNAKALSMCLSGKLKSDKLFVIEAFETEGKTKNLEALKSALGVRSSALLVTAGKDDNTLRSARNIEKFNVRRAQDVNIVDMMHNQYIILSKDAVSEIEKRLTK